MSKLAKLVNIEEHFTNTTSIENSTTEPLIITTSSSENNTNQPILLISCHSLNSKNFLITDHALTKIDIIIRSHKMQNPQNTNTKYIVPLLVGKPVSQDFMQRLDKLGVSQELKENVIFEEDPKFSKFFNLFSKCYFREKWRRNQIGFLFTYGYHQKPTTMLKMYLKGPKYPNRLDELKCDNIIIGAYIAHPEYVFGVANVWVEEDKTYGVYKMKYCNDVLIHSKGTTLMNAFKLGYIESTESIMDVYGSSLMGCSVSFGASKSDKLYILPSNYTRENIMASVPSQESLHYDAWESLGKRNDQWKSYKDHCEPVPFLNLPRIGYHGYIDDYIDRSDAQFINREFIWNILMNNELPEKKIITDNETDSPARLLLDDCFDSDFLRGYFKLKFKSIRKQKLSPKTTQIQIVNWIISKNLGFPLLENSIDRSSIKLVLDEPGFLIVNETQYGVLLEFSHMSAFLILLFKALEKNSIDYLEEGHSFTEYLKSDHTIWKDLNTNLIHYQLTCEISSINYERVFPRLTPTITFFTEAIALDGEINSIQNRDDEKRRLIDDYSASSLRITLAHAMFKEESFETSVAISTVHSLHKFLEIVEVYSKCESIQNEEMDELDNLFMAVSSARLLKAHSAYSTLSFHQVVAEGWFFAQHDLKEYINRKTLLKKSPNTQLLILFLKRLLRLWNPIIPAFASYCWNELLGVKEPIEIYENIPRPDTKYVIVAYLIGKILNATKPKSSTKTVRICVSEKQDWHLKAISLLKTYEDKIISNQEGYMTEIVKYIKEHDLPKQTIPFIGAMIDLYKNIGAEILDNDWDEYELIKPHIEWISELHKPSGKQMNFLLERSSTTNPFFPYVKLM